MSESAYQQWIETRFQKALDALLEMEGGEGDDPSDPGGKTHHGISLRFLRRINMDIDGDGDVDEQDIDDITADNAKEIYRHYWWETGGGNERAPSYQWLAHRGLIDAAMLLFQFSVNMGYRRANRLLQRALRCQTGTVLEDDGILGPATKAVIQQVADTYSLGDKTLELLIRSEAAAYYRLLGAQPRFERYLNGWLNRAYNLGGSRSEQRR